MKLLSKAIVTGLSVLLVQFAFAEDADVTQSSPPKECQMPSAPAPCSTPCAPKPCAPAPCPKPCPPKPCKPCPPVCFERGYPNGNCCFPAAYNEPANYDLGPCPWDFWIDASFTYWQPLQEGLNIGVNTIARETPINGHILVQEQSYKPGFKIGLGMDLGHDDWSTYAEYTWFRSKTSKTSTAPADTRVGTPVFALDTWMVAANEETVNARTVSSKWRLNMDLVDLGIMRPFYEGTHLIMAPFGGVRGQFIRQDFSLTAQGLDQLTTAVPSVKATHKSHSWAVGPRAGCLAKWHLGWGVRFEGDVAASLLYTRYTKVSYSQNQALAANAALAGPGSRLHNYNCLRAVNEMNMGIGWGSYVGCRNYHLDLLLSYDFQVYWNQNMMRELVDATFEKTGSAASNLYLQGLTVKAQFDF